MVSTQATLPLDPVNIISLDCRVVPVVVRAPQPFMFIGVWTHNQGRTYAKMAWDAMSLCARKADKMNVPIVVAGDFNVWPGFSGKKGILASQFLDRMEAKLGLVSAYHHFFEEHPGKETRFTYYHQWKQSKPFHIDYCFVPKGWLHRIKTVEVGSFGDWQKDSDHRPLNVELDP